MRYACIVFAALSTTSCAQDDAVWSGELPAPDRALFESAVYPILLRDCAFSECHGAPQRFLQVFGPGRTRLPGHPADPDLVPREKEASYRRAAALLVAPHPGDLARAPLLTKPLEVSAGGAAHEGVDVFGRNLFQTTDDPRFQQLLAWALTQ
ncbi:MAG: hypothetical protein RL701_6221 [Pseudomonadota bacterium]|jgi:hypothetical protein